MSIIQAIILGVVQGLTEFIPVSSSAHLVLVPFWLGWDIPTEIIFPFDVLVQIGTLIAVIVYFWNDLITLGISLIKSPKMLSSGYYTESKLVWLLILSTVPAGFFGIFLKDFVERAFSNPFMTCIFLYLTCVLLVLAEKISNQERDINSLGWTDAVWIGFTQVFALFPGISRSGATIFGGMVRNLNRKDAARYSFLMSIPIMAAAGAFSISDLLKVPNLDSFLPVLLIGFLTSTIVGFLSIKWLLNYLSRRSLSVFAVYCFIIATLSLIAYAI